MKRSVKKILINENQFKLILNENNASIPKVFINYGRKFDRSKFKEPTNPNYGTKPRGGFWSSPEDPKKHTWRKWADNEDFKQYDDRDYFRFGLSPKAKVMSITSKDDVKKLGDCYDDSKWPTINFEKLKDLGYDAMYGEPNSDLNFDSALNAWDVDSLLVLNPDVIVPYTDDDEPESLRRHQMDWDWHTLRKKDWDKKDYLDYQRDHDREMQDRLDNKEYAQYRHEKNLSPFSDFEEADQIEKDYQELDKQRNNKTKEDWEELADKKRLWRKSNKDQLNSEV